MRFLTSESPYKLQAGIFTLFKKYSNQRHQNLNVF